MAKSNNFIAQGFSLLSHFKIEKHLYYLLLCHNFQSTSDCFKGLPILDMAMIARNAHWINNKAAAGDIYVGKASFIAAGKIPSENS